MLVLHLLNILCIFALLLNFLFDAQQDICI